MIRRLAGPVLMLAVLALVVPGTPGFADADTDAGQPVTPVVQQVLPRTGEVVDPGPVHVSVLTSAAPDANVHVAFGDQVVPEAPEPPAAGLHRHDGTVDLPPGDHIGRVDVDGQLLHLWRFTVAPTPIQRLDGTSVAARAALAASDGWPLGDAAGAVLVRDDGVADALAGVALAARAGGPLLVTGGEALDADAAAGLQSGVTPGSTVYLLGGSNALGPQVAEDVTALGFAVMQVAGADRYDTAAQAAALPAPRPSSPVAYLVSGISVADAIPASVLAALDGAPVLLTGRDELPWVTREALRTAEVTRVQVIGGPAVISDAVLEGVMDAELGVRRLAGEDRAATAAAVARSRAFPTVGASIVGSADPLAALVAASHAARVGHPLLLSDGPRLTDTVRHALDALRGGALVVHGQVDEQVTRTVRTLLTDDGPAALVDLTPAPGTLMAGSPAGGVVTAQVTISSAVDLGASLLTAVVDHGDLPTKLTIGPDPQAVDVTLRLPPEAQDRTSIRFVGMLSTVDGEMIHVEWGMDVVPHNRRYATVGGVDLYEPSLDVELIGFHQSGHDGAREQAVLDNGTPTMVMPSRGRGTGRQTAADIASNPDLPVTAPATGTVIRAQSYQLYCNTPDYFLVIEPDQHPGWEVKLLHFTDLAVSVGDHVVGGQTLVGSGPRKLPFRSQIDEATGPEDWPHVHVEVVDPSIPDRPGGSC